MKKYFFYLVLFLSLSCNKDDDNVVPDKFKFNYNLHSSLPQDWIDEFNVIMGNLDKHIPRLFVAITAGHIVLLSFIGMTFIFQSYFVGILSALFAVALNIIELLVAAIQAYVFTMFSSVYIGLAIEEEH